MILIQIYIIGLDYGAMEYNQIGFANIRLPSDSTNVYEYSNANLFPEEVFIHEFLHTLERNEKDNGNEVISLHDYAKYGYTESRTEGLKKWYRDYMRNEIDGGQDGGLTDFAYSSKPIQNSNFVYSMSLDYFKEPQNIIEEIRSIVERTVKLFR